MGYVFDPDQILAISKLGIGLAHEPMCRAVIDGLAARYPGHVETNPQWVFNLAAGATGCMALLHCSLTEYVILFGSAIGTEGYSGRYHLDIYDAVITGEMWTCTEDRMHEKTIHKPGELAHLRRRTTKAYRIVDGTWMLEYGRGLVPTALPVGLADATLSALDARTVWKTVKSYGRLAVRELLAGKI
jgi:hypothetical protein